MQNIEKTSRAIEENLGKISGLYDENNPPNIILEAKNLLIRNTGKYTDIEKNLFLEELKKCLKSINLICKATDLEEEIEKISRIINKAYHTLDFDEKQIESDLQKIKNIVNIEIETPNNDDGNQIIQLFKDLNDQINISNDKLQKLKEYQKNSTQNKSHNSLNSTHEKYNNSVTETPIIMQDIERISIRIQDILKVILVLYKDQAIPSEIIEIKNFLEEDIDAYTDKQKTLFLEELKKCLKLTNDIYQITYLQEEIEKINKTIHTAYTTPNIDTQKTEKNLRKIKTIIDSAIRASSGDDNRIKLFKELNKKVYYSTHDLYHLNYSNYLNHLIDLKKSNKKQETPIEYESQHYFNFIKSQIEIYNKFPEYITVPDITEMEISFGKINKNHINEEDFEKIKSTLKIIKKKYLLKIKSLLNQN